MGSFICFDEFVEICRDRLKVFLTESEKIRIKRARDILERAVASGGKFYAINTGVGAFWDKNVPLSKMSKFQENLILSHACGVGDPLEVNITRGIMLHIILNLKKGYSGVSLRTAEFLIRLFNEDIVPVVPSKGSLGASGDLIPQAHVAALLMGKGDAWYLGEREKAATIFKGLGINPLKLKLGEAIALLNGTSYMISHAVFAAFHTCSLIWSAHIAAAMSFAALEGDIRPIMLEPQEGSCHRARNISAYFIAKVLGGDKYDIHCNRLQDAYSLRCAPRVFGGLLECFFHYFWKVVLEELNNFGGNPEIFFDKRIVEQGRDNFHGQSIAQAADSLSIGLADISGISERRIEKLLNGSLKSLPKFLTKNGGLDTGLMIAQYTAAALVAENRFLANPASTHSISVAAGQEDFVSMGALATEKLWKICRNTKYIIAIELMCASRAMELTSSSCLKNSAIKRIQEIITDHLLNLPKGTLLSESIENVFGLIHNNSHPFLEKIEKEAGLSSDFFVKNMLN